MTDRLDWLVFGDDWGAHVSTTQHLIRALPPEDRVVWVDSIGMRTPSLSARDLGRVAQKARALLHRPGAPAAPGPAPRPHFARVRPVIAPFHLDPRARALNGRLLARQVAQATTQVGARPAVLLTVNPVVQLYRRWLPDLPVVYLRLDDYAHFPGVQPALVRASEPALLAQAALTVAPSRALVPPGGLYLPQGVDAAHFGRAPVEPPEARVVGFFGLVGDRIDAALVDAVVRLAPDWTFEFVGRVEGRPAFLDQPNVRTLGPVAYAALPETLGRWRACWTPYRLDADGLASNPLKIREALAAGLPTHCTPIPAVVDLVDCDATDAAGVAAWLATLAQPGGDDADRRRARRAWVAGDSWTGRARALRDAARRIG